MATGDQTLAAVGCSGEVGRVFVEGFLKRGIKLRILARDPGAVSKHFPHAGIVKGDMMNPADVTKVMEGVDAAFVLTPMSPRNGTALEIRAMKSIIGGGAKGKAQALHLHIRSRRRQVARHRHTRRQV